MGRSVKKGPFVDQKLLARIVAMNEKNEKNVKRHGQELPQYSRIWLVTP